MQTTWWVITLDASRPLYTYSRNALCRMRKARLSPVNLIAYHISHIARGVRFESFRPTSSNPCLVDFHQWIPRELRLLFGIDSWNSRSPICTCSAPERWWMSQRAIISKHLCDDAMCVQILTFLKDIVILLLIFECNRVMCLRETFEDTKIYAGEMWFRMHNVLALGFRGSGGNYLFVKC